MKSRLEHEIFGDSLRTPYEVTSEYMEHQVEYGKFTYTKNYASGYMYVGVSVVLPYNLDHNGSPLFFQTIDPTEFNEKVLDVVYKSSILNPDKFHLSLEDSVVPTPFLTNNGEEVTAHLVYEVDIPDDLDDTEDEDEGDDNDTQE